MQNMILFCLTLFDIIFSAFSSPVCCQNASYYTDFLMALDCAIVLCKKEGMVIGETNLCITCSPKTPQIQNDHQDLNDLKINQPYLLCQYIEIKNHTFQGNLVLSWQWKSRQHSPVVFMVESRSNYKIASEWGFVGMTNETFADVSNLDPVYRYQFRITSVISSEGLSQSKISEWISIKESNENESITAPTAVNISQFRLQNNNLEVTVTWNSSKEKPCTYKIFWMPDHSGYHYEELSVTLPGDTLSVILHNLLFETNYTVIVSPSDLSRSKNVQSVEASFVTPSCLGVTGSNFSLCAPGPPLNVSVDWITSSEVLITWCRPSNVTAQNNINGYHIVVEEDTGQFKKVLLHKTSLLIGPNSTNVTVFDLRYSSHYVFGIQAVSSGGAGMSSVVELNARSLASLSVNSIPFHFIVPLLIVPIAIAVALAVHMTCKRYRTKETYPTGVADVDDDIRPFLISSDKVELKEVVGQGAFGIVHRGILCRSKSRDEVAVKVYPSETIKRHQMLHEVNMLRVLGRHEGIVGFIGFTLGLDKMSLIFEYCKLGNLHSHLVSLKPELMYMKSLPTSERSSIPNDKGHGLRLSSYIYQVAKGMEYISSLKIVHRDIAARNILMSDENRVKIADFGLSKEIYQNKYYASRDEKRFPIKWMAPEAIEKQKFSTYSDVWSFGVFMWEVFRLGKEPYPGIECANILQYLKMGYRMEKPHCSEKWYSIMNACWNKVPRERPNFKELVNMIGAIIDSATQYVILT